MDTSRIQEIKFTTPAVTLHTNLLAPNANIWYIMNKKESVRPKGMLMAKENIVIIKYSIVFIFPKGFSCSFCKDSARRAQ